LAARLAHLLAVSSELRPIQYPVVAKKKEREPTKEDVAELQRGVEKVIKTVW